MRSSLPLGFALIMMAGCTNEPAAPTGPAAAPEFAVRNENDLHFLSPDSGAPSLAETSVSFYAVRGQDREAFIWYHRKPGDRDSTKLARIKVPKESLVRRPNGTLIAPGDSLLITMSVPDLTRIEVALRPSGLRFAAGRPAKLTIWYLEADHDFNDDGVINGADSTIERRFQLWAQEKLGDPFRSLTTVLRPRVDQAEADLPGFTRYAVAF
jgi:hypothetical protein